MKTGLLESLQKYSPRGRKDPLENFITEAFSWILNKYPDFSVFFLDQLRHRDLQLAGMMGENCEWKTQHEVNGFKLDMVCVSTINENMIIFEHKTWSRLSENQLQNYRDAVSQNTDGEVAVVLITATRQRHDQNPDLPLCWSDIYKLISDWIEENREKNTDVSFIFDDFIKLLRSVDLGPPAPISHTSIKYYLEAIKLKQNIKNLINRAENEFVNLNLEYDDRWGRVGLGQRVDLWRPGIFVGILLDGTDHRTEPVDSAKGPDFCLILDFKKELHNEYPENTNYQEMVSNLASKVENLNKGWQFYNHLDDVGRPNTWHPIHIRKPMLVVFEGTSDAEAQDKVFCDTANLLIKTVTDEDCFQRLREDYNCG